VTTVPRTILESPFASTKGRQPNVLHPFILALDQPAHVVSATSTRTREQVYANA